MGKALAYFSGVFIIIGLFHIAAEGWIKHCSMQTGKTKNTNTE